MLTSSLVSIIVPCYGQAHFLSVALNSVLNQSYSHWECIIVNDGSLDNTSEVAEEWEGRDKRFRYIEKTNGGLSSARNAGIDASKGDYIQFLDADDLILPDKIKHQVELMQSMVFPSITYTDYFTCDVNDLHHLIPERYLSPILMSNSPLEDIARDWETRLSIPVHCFIFDARIFRDKGVKFNESLPNHEDWDCWMQVFALNPTVRFINEKMAIYRIRTNGMCYDFRKMRYGFLQAIRNQKRLLAHNIAVKQLLDEKEREIRYIYRNVGFWGQLFKYAPRLVRALLARFIPWRIQRMFD